jgi:hypothetical protein
MKDKKIIIFLILFFPFISWITLSLIFGKINRKFDELALGNDNVIVINKIQDQEFLCSSADNIFNCIEFLRSKDFKKKILWVGNSQLYAVNQGTFNSKIAPYLVSEYFYKKNIGVIVFAAPNISFQEYSEVIKYLSSNIDLDYIILPLVFDDTRENNIRNNLITKKQDLILDKITLQEITEKKIINFLDRNINWIQIRSQSQGFIYEFLYRFRNYTFNISPEKVRKSIKPIYEKNISSLNEVLINLKNNKTETILYIAPIRNDIKIPYDLQEYSQFKNKVENLAKDFSANFYNLENIIPGKFWGIKNATKLGGENEVDFMHFKEEGHSILANEIIIIIENIIK